MRVDFNVPMNPDGTIADDTRIKESLHSIRYVLEHGGSVILMSHLGRPKGKKDPKLSLEPCAKRLSEYLHFPVPLAPDCIGPKVEKMAAELPTGRVLLLENLRFHAGEENPDSDPDFVKKLAKLGDVYVNDAFGTAHRAHASTALIADYFPKESAAGFLMEREIAHLSLLVQNPKRPFFVIIGGAKVSSKMGVLKSLLSKVDKIFIGGAMAYTFLKAQGRDIGNSMHEDDLLDSAKQFLKEAKSKNVSILLPLDHVIADRFQEIAEVKIVLTEQGIPDGWQGMDIGPKTIELWRVELTKGETIFWNGPLGVFEFPQFARGTQEIAKLLAHLKATTIVGGGDSVSAINSLNLAENFSHISTGGGASLEFLEFGHLPGIDALTDAPIKIL